ncbi:hypothetical protein ACN2C6_14275 [Caulobacter sp. ErkDOM-YI]|uniref:hypothetical protein n=1 Tax=unclassified Caulobacter TaxID=2648921 RepID=UPI003AF54A1C
MIAPAPGRALARTAPPDGASDATATFAADTVTLGVGYSWGVSLAIAAGGAHIKLG